jgi:predicted amino acid-binding ACT domain protein
MAADTPRHHRTRLLLRARRNALAMGTAIGALFGLGYGRGAYASCSPLTGAVVCSGTETVTQNITGPATITTAPGFSINTAVGDAISISGSGPVSFVEAYGSSIIGFEDAIQAIVTGTGDLTITTTGADSTVTGGVYGILALQYGTGALSVTANGEVTGTIRDGIFALIANTGTGDLTVTTGADSTVTGGYSGILAQQNGTGALSVTANGEVTGNVYDGIFARISNSSASSELTVTTGVSSTVSGGQNGINARQDGTGALTVTANGEVTGTTSNGISGWISNATSIGALTVTTGPDSIVTGGFNGIYALQFGTGALTVTANGNVTGTDRSGIYARISNSLVEGTLGITTGADSIVTGGYYGIRALQAGTGALSITADGNATGTDRAGIYARISNSLADGELAVTTGADSIVTGGGNGIQALQAGTGALSVTADGEVAGTNFYGIRAEISNSSSESNLAVTTGADSTVTGGRNGVYAQQFGTGALTVTANGNITGTDRNGIYARISNSLAERALAITTGTDSAVTGGLRGINARQQGTGALSVTANGEVTGTNYQGILAQITNSAATGNLTITTGADSTVTGGQRGIEAQQQGTGALEITANGDVTGTNREGIFAQIINSDNDNNLTVTTGVGTTVSGGDAGISAVQNGTGGLAVSALGDVTGTAEVGIFALISNYDNYSDLTVTTGASTALTGGNTGIYALNYGYGALTVTAGGDVTGMIADGIFAQIYNSNNYNGLTVSTGVGTTVSGAERGIAALQEGYGALTITANGDVTGTDVSGIFALISNANNYNDLTVTTGADSTVSSDENAINARHEGTGGLSIAVNGDVAGAYGIVASLANASASGDLSVTTGADTAVDGRLTGILALQAGAGALTVTANGGVTGAGGTGIFVQTTNSNSSDLTVTTGVGTVVSGFVDGINARQQGTGALSVTANGDVAATNEEGIFALISNNDNYSDLTVTTGIGTTVTGGDTGISAEQQGIGALTITANGDVTGTDVSGIFALISNANNYNDLTVTTGADSTVSSDENAINARHEGTGGLSIAVNGDVAGAYGIVASLANASASGDLSVTTGADTAVDGRLTGILALQAGAGALTVTANGGVTGAGGTGIFVQTTNSNSSDLTVTTGADSAVTGSSRGINALQFGTGGLSIAVNGDLNGGSLCPIYVSHHHTGNQCFASQHHRRQQRQRDGGVIKPGYRCARRCPGFGQRRQHYGLCRTDRE